MSRIVGHISRIPPSKSQTFMEIDMTDVQIKHMVDRFLCWKLPETFNPDGGVTFTKVSNPGTAYEHKFQPVGTNILSATEAEAMVRHMVDGMPR